MLTTQFVVPLTEGCGTRDAWNLKKHLDDEWLKTHKYSQVQRQTLKTVMDTPPSQEARRRAGSRAYRVVGRALRKAAQARQELAPAKVQVQWSTPLEVYIQGAPGLPRPICVATWKTGEWSVRATEVLKVFGEAVAPSDVLASLAG